MCHVRSYVFTASSNGERIEEIFSFVGFSTASIKVENSPKYLALETFEEVVIYGSSSGKL